MSDVRQFAIISEALEEAWRYLADFAYADPDGENFLPNRALRLQTEIERAQAALALLRQTNPDATIYNAGR